MSTSDVESGTDLSSSSNSALPDQERHTERVVSRNGVCEFLVVKTPTGTPINWWIDERKKGNFDTLHLYALDYLSCPAMAT